MMRYIWPILFVAAAVGASLVLVPSTFDFAFMRLRDKEYAAALGEFEARYKRGEQTRDVVFPLADLYERDGAVDNAIEILTKYLAANPQDTDAKKRLAGLQEDAQQLDGRIKTLEKLAASNPSADKLRELARLQDVKGHVDGRIAALNQLAAMGEANETEHGVLANLLAAQGKRREALTVLFNAMQRWPATLPVASVQTFLALAADEKRTDLFSSIILPWAQKQADIRVIEGIASTYIDKGQTDEALRFVDATAAMRAGAPDTIVLAARLEDQFGKPQAGFARLQRLAASERLPANAEEIFVGLALRLNESEAAFARVLKKGPAVFNDALLIYTVNQAFQLERKDTISAIAKGLDTDKAPARPLVQGSIAYVQGDPAKALVFADSARTKIEAPRERLLLSGLYTDLKAAGPAREILTDVAKMPDSLSAEELSLAIPVAVTLKEAPLAMTMANLYRARQPGPLAEIHYARALTVNGRGEEAITLLETVKAPGDLVETAVFEALRAVGRLKDLQDKLYAKLQIEGLSDVKRSNAVYLLNDLKVPHGPDARAITEGLVDDLDRDDIGGQPRLGRIDLLAAIAPKEALPFVKDLAESDIDQFGYVYLDLLKKLGMSAERRRFLLQGVQEANSVKVQDDYLFELLKGGTTADLLPFLKERAEDRGIEWFYAYDGALKRLDRREERLAFLVSYANRDELKPEIKRMIGFSLLELGRKDLAIVQFKDLAAASGPKAPDTQQLLYLWGPRPNAEEAAWIIARANAAPDAEAAGWIAALNNAGQAHAAAEAGERAYASGNTSVVMPYAQALAEIKGDAALSALLDKEFGATGDAKQSFALAQTGEARGLNGIASRYYEKAASQGMKTALEPAARTAFYAGERTRARPLIERALAAGPETAELHLLKGETLRVMRDEEQARASFEKALSIARNKNDRKSRQTAMLAEARLSNFSAARSELARLSKPVEDREAKADLANTFIDQGDLEEAGSLLGYE